MAVTEAGRALEAGTEAATAALEPAAGTGNSAAPGGGARLLRLRGIRCSAGVRELEQLSVSLYCCYLCCIHFQ